MLMHEKTCVIPIFLSGGLYVGANTVKLFPFIKFLNPFPANSDFSHLLSHLRKPIFTGLENKNFLRKNVYIFLPISFNICFGCSKEPSH